MDFIRWRILINFFSAPKELASLGWHRDELRGMLGDVSLQAVSHGAQLRCSIPAATISTALVPSKSKNTKLDCNVKSSFQTSSLLLIGQWGWNAAWGSSQAWPAHLCVLFYAALNSGDFFAQVTDERSREVERPPGCLILQILFILHWGRAGGAQNHHCSPHPLQGLRIDGGTRCTLALRQTILNNSQCFFPRHQAEYLLFFTAFYCACERL